MKEKLKQFLMQNVMSLSLNGAIAESIAVDLVKKFDIRERPKRWRIRHNKEYTSQFSSYKRPEEWAFTDMLRPGREATAVFRYREDALIYWSHLDPDEREEFPT